MEFREETHLVRALNPYAGRLIRRADYGVLS